MLATAGHGPRRPAPRRQGRQDGRPDVHRRRRRAALPRLVAGRRPPRQPRPDRRDPPAERADDAPVAPVRPAGPDRPCPRAGDDGPRGSSGGCSPGRPWRWPSTRSSGPSRRSARGAAGLSAFLLFDAGLLFGQLVQRQGEILVSVAQGLPEFFADVPRLMPHLRVPTPALALPFFLVHLALAHRARRLGTIGSAVAAGVSLGAALPRLLLLRHGRGPGHRPGLAARPRGPADLRRDARRRRIDRGLGGDRGGADQGEHAGRLARADRQVRPRRAVRAAII